jgi:hypothetical protein
VGPPHLHVDKVVRLNTHVPLNAGLAVSGDGIDFSHDLFRGQMHRIVLIVSLLLTSVTADAQRVCKRGIPCGNTCIAANRTCRVGPGKAAGAPQGGADTVALKAATVVGGAIPDSIVAPARPTSPRAAVPSDSAASDMMLAKGGQTKVWANTKSRVYHCPGSRYYGTSSAGEWMTEAAAIKANYRGAYNKRCGG